MRVSPHSGLLRLFAAILVFVVLGEADLFAVIDLDIGDAVGL